jgi:hypothetical protein
LDLGSESLAANRLRLDTARVLLHGAPGCSLVVISEQKAIIFLYGINWLAFRRVRKIAKSEY